MSRKPNYEDAPPVIPRFEPQVLSEDEAEIRVDDDIVAYILDDESPTRGANKPLFTVQEIDDASEIDSVFTAMEYEDSKGAVSRRRITMVRFKTATNGKTSVYAYCHERKAVRQFRIDRIKCFIEPDGEIVDPGTFWSGIGIDIESVANEPSAAQAEADIANDQVVLLVALSQSDGAMSRREIDAICAYAKAMMEKRGMPMTADEVDKLHLRIERMRPTQASIRKALRRTLGERRGAVVTISEEERQSFLRAAKSVAIADGVVDPEEAELLHAFETGSL
ncbi:MAG: TerB family tellurite resistance protein [Myxococcota bacterium]